MTRLILLAALFALTAGCGEHGDSMGTGRVQQLVKSDARMVGYLYSADQPYINARFSRASLQWRSAPGSMSSVEGPAKAHECQPPPGTGFPEVYYLSEEK